MKGKLYPTVITFFVDAERVSTLGSRFRLTGTAHTFSNTTFSLWILSFQPTMLEEKAVNYVGSTTILDNVRIFKGRGRYMPEKI